METVMRKISEVKMNPNNPRLIKDGKFKQLVESIKSFPQMLEIRPIVVNDDMIVLGGNMRLKACKEAGLKEVPVIMAKDLTPDQQREFIVKDNVGFGEWDMELLGKEWDKDDLAKWGLDIEWGEEKKEESAQEDNFEIPDDIKTDIIIGDLFQIGEHRLLCGDSTNVNDVGKLMQGERADLGHNDPPYGMKKEKDGVLNDNLNYDDLLQFNLEWIAIQFTVLKENGSFYCWGIDEPLMDIYSDILKPYIKEQKATFRNLITWDKGNGQGQNSENTRSYAMADEKCLFAMCGVQGFNNNSDNYFEGWEPVRQYLETQIKGLKESDGSIAKALGYKDGRTVNHWWNKSQFAFPTRENYEALRKYAQSKDFDLFKKDFDELKKDFDELKKEYYSTRAYFNNIHDNFNNVWHFERHYKDGSEGNHATPKPIPLCERVIKSSSPEGGVVIDFFLGSGSTMIASHQLKRRCYGIELDPKYCQVIINRMQSLDPTVSVLRNGKPYVRTAGN